MPSSATEYVTMSRTRAISEIKNRLSGADTFGLALALEELVEALDDDDDPLKNKLIKVDYGFKDPDDYDPY